MDFKIIAILIVFLPLLGALLCGLNTKFISPRISHFITCLPMSISAVLSFLMFWHIAMRSNIIEIKILQWFATGTFYGCWAVYIDSLTAVMLVVVTTVSALVHIYSIGYMSHDPHQPRFMSYLSLFTFCMLMLVTSNNFFQLFFGWEGVGLCSYLLIGFWYKKESASSAAIKAFLVNRVGDLGFALGIFATFMVFENAHFSVVFSNVSNHLHDTMEIFGTEYHALTVISLLLFVGAMGKSAQLGLHTWLPDAMEGPTPVSALIHAATMVTAGVFMLARLSPIFEHAPFALDVVTCVGACTCIFAATIALVQDDIKKIIAYSTCSQLGYMFFACGVSAYSAGVFHLMTHAFFKALLFLSAGSVIHAMSNEQNIFKMGGIYKKIPYTYAMIWIGSLALGGMYPFAGFFSKDLILESAYMSGARFGEMAYWFGIAAAMLTALYSWRLIILCFHGKPNASEKIMKNIHESGFSMSFPLFVLAIGAVFSGIFGYKILGMLTPEFWGGAIYIKPGHDGLQNAHLAPKLIVWMPIIIGLFGVFLAWVCYSYKRSIADFVRQTFSLVYKFLVNKWYFDHIYDILFVRSAKYIGLRFWKCIDQMCVDRCVRGFASISQRASNMVGQIQTGYVYHYAFVMMLGLLCLLSWALFLS